MHTASAHLDDRSVMSPFRSGDPEEIAAVKDRFPRGGAMGLLDRSCPPPA